MLVSAYLLVAAATGWMRSTARTPALPRTVGGLLFVCAAELLVFGIVIGLALLASRASRDDLLLRWRGGFLPVPLGIAYSVALRAAAAVAMMVVIFVIVVIHPMTLEALQQSVLARRPDVEAIVDVSVMSRNPVYFWLVLTLGCFVVAGLREELWRSAFLAGLRSLWPRRFGSRGGQILAAAVAAVIFGIGHVAMGATAVALTAVIGFGLGVIMVLHRSIWPAVLAHGVFDATSMAMLPWLMEH